MAARVAVPVYVPPQLQNHAQPSSVAHCCALWCVAIGWPNAKDEMTGLHWLALVQSLWPIVAACLLSFAAGVVFTVIVLVQSK
jgi:hypothetical protein